MTKRENQTNDRQPPEADSTRGARNARTRLGELDIVALDGDALAFVEVKAGRAGRLIGPERPALAVGRRKQLQLRRLARAWLATRTDLPRFTAIRFDVVGVTYGADGSAAVEWIRHAF